MFLEGYERKFSAQNASHKSEYDYAYYNEIREKILQHSLKEQEKKHNEYLDVIKQKIYNRGFMFEGKDVKGEIGFIEKLRMKQAIEEAMKDNNEEEDKDNDEEEDNNNNINEDSEDEDELEIDINVFY